MTPFLHMLLVHKTNYFADSHFSTSHATSSESYIYNLVTFHIAHLPIAVELYSILETSFNIYIRDKTNRGVQHFHTFVYFDDSIDADRPDR